MQPHRIHEEIPEPGLGTLVGDLARQLKQLAGLEARLASTEMSHKASGLGRAVALLAGGGALAYAGVLVVLAGLVLLLGLVLPLWLSALIIGAITIVCAYVLVRVGLTALKLLDLVPHTTVESLQDTATWAKEEAA